MSFAKDFKIGLSSYGKALKFLTSKGLGVYMLFPLILMILYVFAMSFVSSGLSESVKEYVISSIGLNDADFFGSDFLGFITSGFVSIFSTLLIFTILSYAGGYIILIIMSPVLSILSEKTDKILTGNDYPFSIQQTMRDISRGVLIALRNGLYGAGLSILVFISMLIPVIGQIILVFSPFIFFIISSYFYGFSFIDYSNERAKRNIKQSVSFVRQHKGLALSNGIVFSIFLAIPFVGSYIAAFVSVWSVIAATIAVYEIENKALKTA